MTVQQDPVQKRPAGVLHDSEQPVSKKPSVLFLVSTSIGVLTILALVISAYYGIVRL
ncbi:hypothetical protein [Leptolyngbya ohadii]|uniref:hypothetical protein n=1 Tax=Leptolyngbya ohadii TaxID=1962290 RepID=UPI0015C671D8|nr:hypothetical protein [Leptolyngbya ohadii]